MLRRSAGICWLALGFCVLFMLSGSQVAVVGAEFGREEFRFVNENKDEIPQAPVSQPPAPAPATSYVPPPYTPPVQPATPTTPSVHDPIPVVPTPTPDFTVAVSPDSQSILNRIVVQELKSSGLVTRDVESYVSGTPMLPVTKRVQRSTSFTITVRSLNGFLGSVGLGVSGAPSGTGCSFPLSMNVPAGGQAVTSLGITTTATTPKGTYTLTVTATYGGASRSDSVELQVEEQTHLEGGGAQSYVLVDDSSGPRGQITNAFAVRPDVYTGTGYSMTNVNGVTVPNAPYIVYQEEQRQSAGARLLNQIGQGVSNAVASTVNAVVNVVSQVVNTVSSAMNSVSRSASQSSPAPAVANTVTTVVNAAKTTVNSAPNIVPLSAPKINDVVKPVASAAVSKSPSISAAVNVASAVIRALFKVK